MSNCTGCSDCSCSACTSCTCCPVGTVAIYDENGNHAGCVTPQEATTYNNDKVTCSAGYAKLIHPVTGEFLACVVAADMPGLVSQLETALLYVGLTYTHVTCNGDADGTASVGVSGGTAPYTIVWTDYLGAAANPAALAPGSYKVTVTDNVGTSQSKDFVITEPAVLGGTYAAMDETSLGAGDGKAIVYPSGGTAPYTYEWKDGGGFTIGQTTQTATTLVPDTYSCVVTDANGCTHEVTGIVVG